MVKAGRVWLHPSPKDEIDSYVSWRVELEDNENEGTLNIADCRRKGTFYFYNYSDNEAKKNKDKFFRLIREIERFGKAMGYIEEVTYE